MTIISQNSDKAIKRFMNQEKAICRVYLFNPVDGFHSMSKASNNNLSMRVPTVSVDGKDVPYTRTVDLTDKQIKEMKNNFDGIARSDELEKVVLSVDLPSAASIQSSVLMKPDAFDKEYLGDIQEYRSEQGMSF